MQQLKRVIRRLLKNRWVMIPLGLVVGVGAVISAVIIIWLPQAKTTYGMSFSAPYAEQLGLDPQQTFLALLDQEHIRQFRLMSYWDVIEAQRGSYDFSQLDWQFDQAASRGATVALAIGLRQPRYPECHIPVWALGVSREQQQTALNHFLVAVVEHYRQRANLVSYQLENEALNTGFGACTDFSRARLAAEYQLVKQVDTRHPVDINVSNQYGVPVRGPIGDEEGLSIYRNYWMFDRDVKLPFTVWYQQLRVIWIVRILHRPTFVHELQAEPWGPAATNELSLSLQNRLMSLDRVRSNVAFASRLGVPQVYLWGGEWWYYQLQHGNHSLWNYGRTLYESQQ